MINKIHLGNSTDILNKLENDSVHLTVTSPPYDCYSDDTEALTDCGWKLIKDIKINDKVLTLNPNTDNVYFCNVIDTFKYEVDDILISFNNTVVDLLVTKNHNMYVTGRDGLPVRERKPFVKKNKLIGSYIKTAIDIKKSDVLKNTTFNWVGEDIKYFYLPELTCKYNKQNIFFESKKIEMLWWVRFMGIYLAEGSSRGSNTKKTPHTYSINIKQKNNYEVSLIREILNNLPFNFKERLYKNITEFTITDRQLWDYLHKFGNSYEKYIPNDIKNISVEYLKEFLLYYLIGDGTKKQNFDYTIEKFMNATSFSTKLLNDLQEIYIKLGYYSKIKKHRIYPIFYKYIKYRNMNMKEVPYKGDVVCVQVQNDNIIYVRRNGKSMFCGNCLRSYKGAVQDDVEYDGFSFPFVSIVKELYRVTCDGGIVVWVVNDQIKNGGETGSSFKQALKFMELGFKLYDTMIYHKNGAPFPEASRYSQVFEYMFVFLKGDKPRVVNLLKDKPNKWAGSSTFGKRSMRNQDGEIKQAESFIVSDYGYRYNVWYVINGAGFTTKDKYAYKHPAMMPESLAEDHILSWSNEGDVVLDPMVGAGTVCKMSKINNRNFIGIDINQEYVDISNRRVSEAVPYTKDNSNPKNKFIISREDILAKRQKNKEQKKKDNQ